MAHPEPAHHVSQDLGLSVEQLAVGTGDPLHSAHDLDHGDGLVAEVVIAGPPAADVAQTQDHKDGQVVQRHVGQTGGAQLGPLAADVAQTHNYKDGQVVQTHEWQTDGAQLGHQVAQAHNQVDCQLV